MAAYKTIWRQDMTKFDLTGRKALVTGGAAGIGDCVVPRRALIKGR